MARRVDRLLAAHGLHRWPVGSVAEAALDAELEAVTLFDEPDPAAGG